MWSSLSHVPWFGITIPPSDVPIIVVAAHLESQGTGEQTSFAFSYIPIVDLLWLIKSPFSVDVVFVKKLEVS